MVHIFKMYLILPLMLLCFTVSFALLYTLESSDSPSFEPPPSAPRPDLSACRQSVLNSFEHAWQGYKRHAYGHDELRPLSNTTHDWLYMSSGIVDSLSTLWLMGYNEEVIEAAQYLETRLNFDADEFVSLFEVNIRILGGLLSAYELTGEVYVGMNVFLNKSMILGDKMMHAFNLSGFPSTYFNFRTLQGKHKKTIKHITSYGMIYSKALLSLAEFGTLQLELTALSYHTNDLKYHRRGHYLYTSLFQKWNNSFPLFPTKYDPLGYYSIHYSLAGGSDSFYEYLIKQYVHTNFTNPDLLKVFETTVEGMLAHLLMQDSSGLYYFGELRPNEFENSMGHLTCFAPGMLMLGYKYLKNEEMKRVAEEVVYTCYQMYRRSLSGLSSELVTIDNGIQYPKRSEAYYALRPEVLESIWYMHYFTGEEKYRQWAWDIFSAIEKWCKTESGYAEIKNVNQEKPMRKDNMQSFFMAETLKYLYFIFSDEQVLDLNTWVLNTEAHPLRIKHVDIW